MPNLITSQFWIGTVDSAEIFLEFMAESEELTPENEDLPLNKFLKSQGESRYDHDFVEYGFSKAKGSIKQKFKKYSYIKFWADQIEESIQKLGLEDVNAFIMIGIDEPPGEEPYHQIEDPCSVEADGINLTYIGEITHEEGD